MCTKNCTRLCNPAALCSLREGSRGHFVEIFTGLYRRATAAAPPPASIQSPMMHCRMHDVAHQLLPKRPLAGKALTEDWADGQPVLHQLLLTQPHPAPQLLGELSWHKALVHGPAPPPHNARLFTTEQAENHGACPTSFLNHAAYPTTFLERAFIRSALWTLVPRPAQTNNP